MAKKTIIVNVTLNNHKLTIDKMRPKAYTRAGDEILWYCADARMKVDFDYPGQPSPFNWTSKTITQGSKVGGVVINPVRIVAYTLTIYHPDYQVVVDPEVESDGGDPGRRAGKKKASKKSGKKKGARKSARKRK